MKKNIYLLGNMLLDFDNKPLRLKNFLSKKYPDYNFVHFDPTEQFPKPLENLVMIDTIIGLAKTEVFENLYDFSISPRNTVHDYDLAVDLGILKKLGKINKFKIIGLPSYGDLKTIKKDLDKILKDI